MMLFPSNPKKEQLYPNVIKAKILNLTPDSRFCENILSESGFSKCLIDIEKDYIDIIDVGAESSSPLNPSIGEEEEIKRLREIFFPYVREQQGWKSSRFLSIDTFRIKTIKIVLEELKDFSVPLIWNDVSGKYQDPEVLELLEEHENLYYVCSHNPANKRGQATDHLHFVSPDETPQEALTKVKTFFTEAYRYFAHKGLIKRIIFDPCFCFGKTREQSQYLARNLKDLVKIFPKDVPWMLGASRKTFLREKNHFDQKDETLIEGMEKIHTFLLCKWMQEIEGHRLIFRVHDTKVIDAAQNALNWFS